MDKSKSKGEKGDGGSWSKSPRSPKVTSSPRKRLKPVALDPSNMASSNEESKESTDELGHMKSVMGLTKSGSPNIVKNKLGDLTKVATEKTRLEFIMGRGSQDKFPVIPFGPRFQAEVPQWTEPVATIVELNNNDHSDHKRWVANRIWAVNDEITKTSFNEIGKGRGDSCNCIAPGSSVCIESHINEKKLKLQGEIGSAFRSWKFDEMGEAVANSWTRKEQGTFKLLKYDERFWVKVGKCFSTKSRSSILSYLFNVFIPRKLRHHAENRLEEINSDCEEIEDSNKAAKGGPNHLKPRAR